MFHPVPKHVIWIYSERVSIPPDLLEDNLIDECYEGYESYQFLRDRVMTHREDGGTLCFFDDALSSATLQRDIDRIFYELGHHSRTSFMMATQELYHQNSRYRTAAKQLSNLWLFPSKRSATEIYSLARQISPTDFSWIVKAFQDATENEAHRYMYFGFHQKSAIVTKMMTHYLPNEPKPIRCYLKNRTAK
jgi:hypothetical protein